MTPTRPKNGVKTLRDYIRDYLQLRWAMGHKLARHEQMLTSFIAELTARGQDSITTEAAIAWACAPVEASPRWWARRLSVVRGLAAYIHSREPHRAQEIPADAITARSSRTVPYLYTPQQVLALMEGATRLRPTVRGLTMAAVIGLMSATGLRISEALALNVTDVDTDEDVLRVNGKRDRLRLVPIHRSTSTALLSYRQAVTPLVPAPASGAFFLTFTGTRPRANNIQVAFRGLVNELRYTPGPGGRPPRLHDMRHSFSTNTLLDAYRDQVDVDARVAVLATYLGHVSPASTYWYLTATPQLLALTADKVAAAQHKGRML